MIRVSVNGRHHELDIDPATPLLYVLIDELGLNGAKYGCGLDQCGACTVLMGSEAVFSCTLPVSAVGAHAITTLEGLTANGPGTLRQAFEKEQAAQCGYCVPGMILRAEGLLRANRKPSEQQLRAGMQTNLCRCGTHMRILRAVRRAAVMRGGGVIDPAEPVT
jgi:nicotinate dehydrogenase subunit A